MEDYLRALENYACIYDIAVYHTRLHSHTPCAASPKHKNVLVNDNYFIQNQLPFQLAHEICHVLHGDDSFSTLYQETDLKTKIEYEANRDAIKILLKLYAKRLDEPELLNYATFEQVFCIPSKLDDVVQQAFKTYLVS